MNTKILSRFGNKLKEIRLEKEFTQEELAEKVGIHATYVGKLESGKNNPSLMMIYKISCALKVKLKDLLDI